MPTRCELCASRGLAIDGVKIPVRASAVPGRGRSDGSMCAASPSAATWRFRAAPIHTVPVRVPVRTRRQRRRHGPSRAVRVRGHAGAVGDQRPTSRRRSRCPPSHRPAAAGGLVAGRGSGGRRSGRSICQCPVKYRSGLPMGRRSSVPVASGCHQIRGQRRSPVRRIW